MARGKAQRASRPPALPLAPAAMPSCSFRGRHAVAAGALPPAPPRAAAASASAVGSATLSAVRPPLELDEQASSSVMRCVAGEYAGCRVRK